MATQRLHTEQCLERSGRRSRQAEQKRAGSKPPPAPPRSDSSMMVCGHRRVSRWRGGRGQGGGGCGRSLTRNLSARLAVMTPGSLRHERRKVYQSASELSRKPAVAAPLTTGAMNASHVM